MPAKLTVPTIFTAIDKFSSTIGKMGQSVTKFAIRAEAGLGTVNRMFNRLTPTLGKASKDMLGFASRAAIAAGIVASLTFGAKSVVDYEVALHSLQAVTGASYKLFQGQIESIAKKSKMSAIDVAGSFEAIGSAMSQYLQDPKSLGLIAQAGITLAKASRQELIPTLEDMTSIMNQFKLEAKDADAVINRLTAGEIVGNMRTSEVAKSLMEFGAGAKLANVNLGESVALVEVLGRQMEHSTVGNAAKNIMIIMDSAKGLVKRARKELLKNHVDLDLLMNHKVSLGTRLKELSKILNDSVSMTKVFGRENKTAGQVILSNLATYNEWEKQIQTTNQAQMQAAANTDTLASKWDQLKNSFTNALVSNNRNNTALTTLKNILGYVADHMETIIGVGVKLVLTYVGVKAVLIGAGLALKAYNIYQAASIALGATATATTAAQTVAVTGFGGAISGVTAELGAANLAATGFFATLSGFVLPAAIAALGGLALWKVFSENAKEEKYHHSLMQTPGLKFNRKTAVGRISPFANQAEEAGYQKWYLSQHRAGVADSLIQRANFDDQFGKSYPKFGNKFDLSALKKPAQALPQLSREPAKPNDSTIHIILNDPSGAVKDVNVANNAAKVTVTSTQKFK